MMKINPARSAGFCFGVKRALRMAFDTAAAGGEVLMLGEIVHNEDVLSDIERAGIRRVRRLSGPGKGRFLLISAHGVPARAVERARKLGYRIVDATCPMVKRIHAVASAEERKGRRVIIIGDPAHTEVLGIKGRLKRAAVVVANAAEAAARAAGLRKASIVVQSTQDMKNVLGIVGVLKGIVPDLVFVNTVCMPTRVKQKEIMSLARKNDVMVIIGSATSANTGRLFEIAASINPRTHRIRTAAGIRRSWFEGARTVGVGAGASTPDRVTGAVVERLADIGRRPRGRRGRGRR